MKNLTEGRFKALIENDYYDVVSLLDRSFKIIYRSPSASRITGWSNDEALNTPVTDTVHPDDKALLAVIGEEILGNPRMPVPSLFRSLHKNGRYIWLEAVSTNLLDDKNVNAIVFNFRDVTERVESEEKLVKSEKTYRSLFENMLHGFAYCKCIYDQGKFVDFTFLVVNDEYERLTGLKNLAGRNISEASPGLLQSDTEYAEIVNRVAQSGNPEKFETYFESMDKWFTISLYSPGKEYFVGLIDNITERKKSEQKIKSINTELEKRVVHRTEQLNKKNEELEAFSYSVSHDLRAPLRSIIGFTTILEEEYAEKFDDEGRRLMSVIKSNTKKMNILIDDLLSFSRIASVDIQKGFIDSNEMVRQIVKDLDQKNANSHIEWIIHPLDQIYGDINTIRQVWINLISNAIKYSARQTNPKVEIDSSHDKAQVVFRIKDNGIGFNPHYTDKLFKVFQRLHGTNEFEGTGIGLAIVEKIISRHNGKVWAKGELDKGASFYFSLPMAAEILSY